MKQLSLFDGKPKTFYDRIQAVIDDIISSHDLPPNSIHLYSNISPKTGKETSKSICIFEPEYPAHPSSSETPGRNSSIVKIQKTKDHCMTLFVRNEQATMIEIPASATIKTIPSDKVFQHIIFHEDDESVCEFVKKNILYCLANYESSNSFGCCDRFIKCSDAKKCVHENKIYAMGCKYRANLEVGKIFYGKNKNV